MKPLRVVLIKPSKYAPDGSVERFRRGFMPNYKDASTTHDGVLSGVMKSGTARKAKVILKGKGGALPALAVPLTAPVTVQLANTQDSFCWEAVYAPGDVLLDLPDRFKGKVERP